MAQPVAYEPGGNIRLIMKPIYLILSMPFDRVETCSSRFWGNPDLPRGFNYPMYIDNEGDPFPYFFICQINLEELAPFDTDNLLPHKGLLSFFAKIDHYMGYAAYTNCIGGGICPPEDVKVLYFPDCDPAEFEEFVILDDNDQPSSPQEMQINFAHSIERYGTEHALFAPPDHRPWETWDPPFEDWEILLQIDSFNGMDFNLNFMDCGVLDFLISPKDLKQRKFDNVRALVLST